MREYHSATRLDKPWSCEHCTVPCSYEHAFTLSKLVILNDNGTAGFCNLSDQVSASENAASNLWDSQGLHIMVYKGPQSATLTHTMDVSYQTHILDAVLLPILMA